MPAIKREITRQTGFFLLVGIASTVLNYLIFLVLFLFFKSSYLFSAGAGFIFGVFFSYGFNQTLTFESPFKVKRTLPLYFSVYIFSLIINLYALYFLVTYFNFNTVLANFLLAPPIMTINFFGTKLIAFKNRKW